ncbi:MAG: hypothetical protein GOVbin4206_32 [Prokaryotic dsDNA virus sp.]|nr:MAG: hypothetical protein GOVbin4206_32 [Prokaryotic dsDNA virus sp.]|tara:strand:- start:1855 stop:2121 length:267 start_codon:yes stop_codon:yes gene_type:complete
MTECRRMTKVTKGDRMLLDSLERSYLDTSEPFMASEAIQAILVTGTKKGRSFTIKINTKKLCGIFRKSDNYELVRKTSAGRIFWRRIV